MHTGNERSLVKQLLFQALQAPEAARADFVRADPEASESVKTEVIQLLWAESRRGSLVAELLSSGPGVAALKAPASIGPYQILKTIGHGGSAIVYLARRGDGLGERDVALKLFEHGWHRPGAQGQFDRELRALAKLEHPNIVRLYDGGATSEGQLYLAMEYIDGAHLDVYCRERSLSLADRLRLFEQVCQGVAYANLRLIVHRDLKPSNVVVTPEGIPKILDFGVAKLLDEDGSAAATTRSLTIKYSSPEQIRGGAVSVASDVYSLGVGLYELIADASPYRTSASDLAGLTDEIVHSDPVPPRSVDPSIPADLEAIVLRALRKEPRERYRSVDAFIEDIHRFLSGQAVEAHRGNAWYRARKFIWRNRLAFAVAALFAGVVAMGVFVSFRYAQKADRNLQQTLQLANNIVRQLTALNNSRDKATLLSIATRTQKQLVDLARENPANDELRRSLLGILLEIGELQGHPDAHNLGDAAGATETFTRAVALAEELYARDRTHYLNLIDLARAHCALGTMFLEENRLDEAGGHYQRAADIYHNLSSSDPHYVVLTSSLATALMYLSEVRLRKNDLEGCLRLRKEIISARRMILAADPGQAGYRFTLSGDLQTYATTLRKAGQSALAIEAFEESIAMSSRLLASQPGDSHLTSQVARAKLNIGIVRLDQGKVGEAVRDLSVACGEFRRIAEKEVISGSNDRDLGGCLTWLSIAQGRAGRLDASKASAREAIEGAEAAIKKHPEDLGARNFLKSIRARLAAAPPP